MLEGEGKQKKKKSELEILVEMAQDKSRPLEEREKILAEIAGGIPKVEGEPDVAE